MDAAVSKLTGMVEEVSELEREEQGQMLDDSLPIGLRLLKPQE